jgi:hypothetical protein
LWLLAVANDDNDSISAFTGGYGNWQPTAASQVPNIDLRPGNALADPEPRTLGGEYPFWVLVGGNASTGYTAMYPVFAIGSSMS